MKLESFCYQTQSSFYFYLNALIISFDQVQWFHGVCDVSFMLTSQVTAWSLKPGSAYFSWLVSSYFKWPTVIQSPVFRDLKSQGSAHLARTLDWDTKDACKPLFTFEWKSVPRQRNLNCDSSSWRWIKMKQKATLVPRMYRQRMGIQQTWWTKW